ncbi:43341_t:CDS:2 [Gigaspora margarita]|uniref:43341_t:CDS:1 n=1 Tax=Gigaspora margarita TaxID=4874 RepID=A0ABN7V2P1_GIGMA|nr:43341_t:CDS:2 [Gigaspora margarita]
MAERKENFLVYSTNKKYKGYWSSASEEKKKDYAIPKADRVSGNKSIFAAK